MAEVGTGTEAAGGRSAMHREGAAPSLQMLRSSRNTYKRQNVSHSIVLYAAGRAQMQALPGLPGLSLAHAQLDDEDAKLAIRQVVVGIPTFAAAGAPRSRRCTTSFAARAMRHGPASASAGA
jgi:hypothetical protein